MARFAVDENVVRNAVSGRNDRGEEALVEGEFMPRLPRVKGTVYVNEPIAKKLRSMRDKIMADSRPEDCNSMICKGAAATLRDGRRAPHMEGSRAELEGRKKRDREFVGVAPQSGGILVASDMKLRRIAEEKRRRGFRIECIGADRALGILGHGGAQNAGGMPRPARYPHQAAAGFCARRLQGLSLCRPRLAGLCRARPCQGRALSQTTR